jgi:hypothetical protein
MSGTGSGVGRQASFPVVPDGPPLADEVVTDPAVEGLPAIVTIRIPGGSAPGEVRLYVRGSYETLIAYAVEPLEVGRHVVVVTSRGCRAAHVEPTINGV